MSKAKPIVLRLHNIKVPVHYAVKCPSCGKLTKPSKTFRKIDVCECGEVFDWDNGYETKSMWVTEGEAFEL